MRRGPARCRPSAPRRAGGSIRWLPSGSSSWGSPERCQTPCTREAASTGPSAQQRQGRVESWRTRPQGRSLAAVHRSSTSLLQLNAPCMGLPMAHHAAQSARTTHLAQQDLTSATRRCGPLSWRSSRRSPPARSVPASVAQLPAAPPACWLGGGGGGGEGDGEGEGGGGCCGAGGGEGDCAAAAAGATPRLATVPATSAAEGWRDQPVAALRKQQLGQPLVSPNTLQAAPGGTAEHAGWLWCQVGTPM